MNRLCSRHGILAISNHALRSTARRTSIHIVPSIPRLVASYVVSSTTHDRTRWLQDYPVLRPTMKKLLIANRGEIACRVIQTAKKLGIRTVAVYSDADVNSKHVLLAHEAYRIGKAPAIDSYLNGEAIIAVARRCMADAIHPGYGFLSESAEFAQAVQSAGMSFVGPPATAIVHMGSKRKSKEIMTGVPCVPGFHGAEQDEVTLKNEATRIGYPVLIKPVYGGGGKGMRVCRSAEEFDDELRSAKREAEKSFGNNDVLLEKWLDNPRHIEVQVFADMHGNCISLSERDCSVQRRHQKIIEEAPAPGLSMSIQTDLSNKAIAAAKAVNYVGAGTVEFIMDADSEQFFFMEMNTRLQVEHPVTEMITGVDLVEWQLGRLPLTQEEVKRRGHAMEARIYAERPEANFLPDTGRLVHIKLPQETQYRLDTGFEEGDEITSHYDPMIAKLIVHGEDRAEALLRLGNALNEYQVVGPSTNVQFLKSIVSHPTFREGAVATNFIPVHETELFDKKSTPTKILAQAALAQIEQCSLSQPWRMLGNKRFDEPAKFTTDLDGVRVTVHKNINGYRVCIGKVEMDASFRWLSDTEMMAQIDGQMEHSSVVTTDTAIHIFNKGQHYSVRLPDLTAANRDASGQLGSELCSPMPATVVDVRVKPGDSIRTGQICCVLESMKMELNVRAGCDGIVKSVNVYKGMVVEEGFELVSLE